MIGEDIGFFGYLFIGIITAIVGSPILYYFMVVRGGGTLDKPDWSNGYTGCGCMAYLVVSTIHVTLFALFPVAMFRFYILLIIFVVICIMAYGVFFKGKR